MKYSKLCLITFLTLFSFSAIAQEGTKDQSNKDLAPREGDFGFSLNLDGLIDQIKFTTVENTYGRNLIFAKYYLDNDKAFRMGFGLNVNAVKRQQEDSVGSNLVAVDSSSSQYFINLSFGYEKHIATASRLDPYLFSQIDLTFIGKKNTNVDKVTTSGAGEERLEKEIKQDGGFAFGLAAGGGFNYFIAKRFSVGAEFAFRLLVAKEGGTISSNETLTPINGNPSVDFNSREDKTTKIDAAVRPNALVNISYFF